MTRAGQRIAVNDNTTLARVWVAGARQHRIGVGSRDYYYYGIVMFSIPKSYNNI